MCEVGPRFCGPFQILAYVRPVAYFLPLPTTTKNYSLFHVSLLKIYVHESKHVIDWNVVQVEP